MTRDIIADSWAALQEELFRESWNESISRFRSPFVFRGLSDASYRLLTSLIRLGGPYPTLERHLLRNFRKYAQNIPQAFSSFWQLLSIAQHYGLPTRLMDWTYSPWVALHFATANHERYDLDGVIWMVNFQQTHERLPEDMRSHLHREGAQAFTVELLTSLSKFRADSCTTDDTTFYDVIQTLEEFDRVADSEEFLMFFEPPSLDERIINQFALFSVMPNPRRAIDEWLDRRPELYRRIIIPAAMKWEFRDKLDQCNITERVLFPGLGGLSTWLRRHYSPKN